MSRFTTESRLGKDPRSNPSENSTFIALLFESLFVSFEFISSSRNSATVCNALSRIMSILLFPHSDNGFTSPNNSIRKSKVESLRAGFCLLASFSRVIISIIPDLIPTSAALGTSDSLNLVFMDCRIENSFLRSFSIRLKAWFSTKNLLF